MSVFDTILSSFGIGAARVDTRLQSHAAQPGENLLGLIVVTGGKVAQDIQRLYVQLMIRYRSDDRVVHAAIASQSINEPFTIQPGETQSIPFSLTIPRGAPVSLGGQAIYLKTGLDIAMALDPLDSDNITIHPHPLMLGVLAATEQLGFYLHRSECGHRFGAHQFGELPYVQEFEFRPRTRGHVQELELCFALGADALEVLVEVDRRIGGLGGLFADSLDLNERRARLRVTGADVAAGAVAGMLDATIQRLARP